MAYTTVVTHVTGDVFPASDWNLYVRDNFSFLHDQGADLASASTITPTNQFHKVTGATQINLVASLAAGARLRLVFTGTPVVSHNNAGAGGAGSVIFADSTNHTFRVNDVLDLVSDGSSWYALLPSVPYNVPFIKTTDRAVNANVADVDLLNGECTVLANALGLNKTARLTLSGDFLQNSGTNPTAGPHFKVKIGLTPTVAIDVGPIGNWWSNAARSEWDAVILISNLGVANSQRVVLKGQIAGAQGDAYYAQQATTGDGSTWGIAGSTGPGGYAFGVTNVTSVDTAVAMAVLFVAANNLNNANYETRLHTAMLEIVG